MADPRRTPWAVLGLDPSWFPDAFASAASAPSDTPTRAALVRRAYRRALLQHHPDKQRAAAGAAAAFTVDDIKAAYAALGGSSSRSGDASRGDGAAAAAAAGGLPSQEGLSTTAATGLEVVDLDELPYDEAAQAWYRSCRCGNPRGFAFGERDLEEELDAEAMETLVGEEEEGGDAPPRPKTISAGELLVGCQDCSLWLCVHFAAAPDGGESEEGDS